jgi:hypothetical protein
MTETVSIDRPSTKPATVSASALALQLDCTGTYIGKLEAEGVITPQGDGFPLDQSRVATVLSHLSNMRALQSRRASQTQHRRGRAAGPHRNQGSLTKLADARGEPPLDQQG